MKVYVYCVAAALLGTAIAWGQDRDGPLDRSAGEEGVEVLLRGPVHEAFAGTITFDPEPGVVVARSAPEPIEELPPEQKPEGENVAWIPGYWGWDDERSDFVWVSGIWRSLPPGRQWISGYWATSEQDSQWTSGYWADAQVSEIDYLPEPPQTVEVGPNIEAPSVDHTWLPGCWIWQQNRYAWQPGYWATAQQDWVWNPPHYVWAPRGYVFVDGYYDYPVARRGILFAPVYFSSSIYSQRGFSYSPRTVINPAVFAAHLFLRPSYGHYYFGDYYGRNYATSGFSPWFSFSSNRYGYDPFYAHQRWNHRDDRQWSQRVETEFTYRRDHDEARPARTWSDQRDRRDRGTVNDDRSLVVATSFEELAKTSDSPIRLQTLDKQEREHFGQRGQQVRAAREERRKLEAIDASSSAAASIRSTDKPTRVKLPKSPIVSQPIDRLDRDQAPPKVLDAPQLDSKVQPQPRKPRGNAEPAKRDPTAPQAGPRPNAPKGNANKPQAGPKKSETPKGPSKAPQAGPKKSETPKGPSNAPQVGPKKSGTPKGNSNKPQAGPKKSQSPKGNPNKGQAGPKPKRDQGAMKEPERSPQSVLPQQNPTGQPTPAPKVDFTARPKETPRVELPRNVPNPVPTVTPRPDPPGLAPMPEPKATPRVTPRPESPRNTPKATAKPKKVNPRPEAPKNTPQATAKPKVNPRPEAPRNTPQATPKVKPRPE